MSGVLRAKGFLGGFQNDFGRSEGSADERFISGESVPRHTCEYRLHFHQPTTRRSVNIYTVVVIVVTNNSGDK